MRAMPPSMCGALCLLASSSSGAAAAAATRAVGTFPVRRTAARTTAAAALHTAAPTRPASRVRIFPSSSAAHPLLSRRSRPPPPPPPSACGRAMNGSGDAGDVAGGARTPLDKAKVVGDMLYRIRRCNSVPEDVRASLLDFVVDGAALGKVTPKVAGVLCSVSSSLSSLPIFQLVSHGRSRVLSLTDAAGATCETRTDAVMSVMEGLRSRGLIGGWRDELYPVSTGFYDEPALLVERAAAPFLGALEYGVHVNGLVQEGGGAGEGEVKMWMARRSDTKSKYPGMLDHVVAGGQPAGIGLTKNVIKECEEEAGVPESVARERARPAGAISYETFVRKKDAGEDGEIDGVISRAVLFCYDLELPVDFIPRAVDGEVESFFTWTMDEVMRSMDPQFPDPIKPNCYPVIVDYLLRAGHVSPETPGYLDMLRELRGGDCR